MKQVLILVARFWQLGPSRVLPPSCRYAPSCSQYASDAVKKYGPVRGSLKAAWRIARCNPWSIAANDRSVFVVTLTAATAFWNPHGSSSSPAAAPTSRPTYSAG